MFAHKLRERVCCGKGAIRLRVRRGHRKVELRGRFQKSSLLPGWAQ